MAFGGVQYCAHANDVLSLANELFGLERAHLE